MSELIGNITAFFLGLYEFRSDFTTGVGATRIEAYDAGRDLAHAITMRVFDNG